MTPDFWKYMDVGKALADLHLGYFNRRRKDNRHSLGQPMSSFGKPLKMAFVKSKDPSTSKKTDDPSKLKINGILVYDNIPKINYRVNGRTPLKWAD